VVFPVFPDAASCSPAFTVSPGSTRILDRCAYRCRIPSVSSHTYRPYEPSLPACTLTTSPVAVAKTGVPDFAR
jgi:hypothetical protein